MQRLVTSQSEAARTVLLNHPPQNVCKQRNRSGRRNVAKSSIPENILAASLIITNSNIVSHLVLTVSRGTPDGVAGVKQCDKGCPNRGVHLKCDLSFAYSLSHLS